ncbi:hypothetical protein [Rhizobium mongolense]|uniref:Tetratricopeptide repeat protein n=1 Tax=Rhizobium mongolense TaxID=57676 RepID=A0A7W6WF76_9HYPH|nr:hypothetical protein [Rhizobium mongolense]MBB4275600.1 hypothetical protein [Rhizobium mongolense]
MRKDKIDPETTKKLDAILKKSADLFQKNALRESLAVAEEAWDLIPEPKEKWDYYPQSLSSGFVQDYVELGDIESFRKWIDLTYRMYDDPDHNSSHYVLMLEGSSLYNLDLKDEAFDVFDRIYNLFGREGFKGEQTTYLEFYLKERARRGETTR